MMRRGVYTTEKEEMVKGYKMKASEKKAKKDRQNKFEKGKKDVKRKK